MIVETTVEKLLSAIRDWGGLFAGRDCFVGQVSYLSGEQILAAITSEAFQRSNDISDTAHMRATGLLMKRPEFEHEREVRAIVECPDKTRRRKSNLVDIPVNTNDFVNGLTIDPRIDAKEFDSAVGALRDAGYKSVIRQSELYRLPWEREKDPG